MITFTEPKFVELVESGETGNEASVVWLDENTILKLERSSIFRFNLDIFHSKRFVATVYYSEDGAIETYISSNLCERSREESMSKTFFLNTLQQYLPKAFEWFLWNKI